jgi:lysozyme family protein
MNFDESFERVVGHEGGYVNDPADPGGETKFGVSKRSYPAENIPELTLERAKVLYKRDFWGPAGCEFLPEAVRDDLFDTAVNAGVKQAIRLLQRACGEEDDGLLGPRTLQACQSMNPSRLVARFQGYRLEFLTSLKGWERFGKGWARRAADYLKRA